MQRSLRVGLTGKFGSGKSTIARLLRENGITVVDSDQLAKDLMQSDEELKQGIIKLLGEGSYAGGVLDTMYVAQKIFDTVGMRQQLEKIVHPAVFRSISKAFEAAGPGEIVVVESALVFQTSLWQEFDYIALVDASDEVITDRSQASGKFDAITVRSRLMSQAYNQSYTQEADIVLQNNGSLEDLMKRGQMLLTLLRIVAQRDLPEQPIHSLPDEELPEGDIISEDDDEDPRSPSNGRQSIN